MSNKKNNYSYKRILILLIFAIVIGITGYFSGNTEESNIDVLSFDIQYIPEYEQSPYIIINNN